ncbi:MAG: alanine racemase [Gammaproteobacteria bacterium]
MGTHETDDAVQAARPSWVEFDLEALAHNYRTLRAHIGPEPHIIAALKANAYGHGAVPVARCLARYDVHSLATGSVEDALAIRNAGIERPILMFGGALPQDMHALVRHGLTPTVYNLAGAEAVSRAATERTAVYVKVDAGLGRLGVPLPDALDFIRHLRTLDKLVLEGVYTHLSFHDAAGRDWSRARLAGFDELLEALDAAGIEVPITQAIASSGLLCGLPSRANAVCPGHLLYGVSPVADDVAAIDPYRPVLKAIKSRLIHVGPIKAGMRDAGPQAPRRVGVIPLGLVDGYRPISARSAACALIAGRRVAIKAVSLEHISLDLSDLDQAEIGDEVVLLGASGGETITLADIAHWQGTRPHHVLMAFDRRLRARYLGEANGPDVA